MIENQMTLMEKAIMGAVSEGLTERADIGKYARTIVSDPDAFGPTLWTENTVRLFADTIDGLVDKGYLEWETYIVAVRLPEKGKKYIEESKDELTGMEKVDDSKKWFNDEWINRHQTV